MKRNIFSDFRKFINIKKIGTEQAYSIRFYGLERKLYLYRESETFAIVGNSELSYGCDVEFTKLAARKLLENLKGLSIDCILTAETRPISLAFELASLLKINHFSVAKKNTKLDSEAYLSEDIQATTTSAHIQRLYLDTFNASLIENKSILIVDDVISTGNTLEGLINLSKKANAHIKAIACIWLEGPWIYDKLESFSDEYNYFIFLDILPIYAGGKSYVNLQRKTQNIKDEYFASLNHESLEKVLSIYWGVEPGNKVLILTDNQSSNLFIDSLSRVLEKIGGKVGVIDDLGLDFDEDFPADIKNEFLYYDIIILAASQSWYHAPSRRTVKHGYKKKVLEAYGMVPGILKNGGLFADYEGISKLGNRICGKLENKGIIEINSILGTSFKLSYSSLGIEDGIYCNPASGGNFPAGEISFGITSEDANGVLVFDVSFDELGNISSFPLKIYLEKGRIVHTEGEYAKILECIFKKHPTLSSIAEVGIGLNPSCITERSILEDEKKAGNVHIGFGNNTYFGGTRTGPHYDGVIADATVKVNGKEVLVNGSFSEAP